MKKMNMGGMTKHAETMHGIKPEMTKGVKAMKKGGPTSLDRKTMGRNMSRAKNQRGK
jgi:hypothetical protein